MRNLSLNHWLNFYKKILALLSIGFVRSGHASTTGGENLPFETTLDTLQKSISGPVLTSMSIIMVAITCLMLAFGEWGEGFKKIINIVLWLSVAFAAVSFLNHMFGAGAVF